MSNALKKRVWWIPQIPMKAFFVEVRTFREARLLLDALAQYDLFQFKHKIKPDYANAGGLQVFDPDDMEEGSAGSWVDWENDEDGRGIHEFSDEEIDSLDQFETGAV